MPTATSGSRAASTTCSRSKARRSTRRRSKPSLRAIPGVAQAFVTNVIDADGADQVGAVVVTSDRAIESQLATEARARMSAFKAPDGLAGHCRT